MNRSSIKAVRTILAFLALCGVSPALLTCTAQAATVFSNYNGSSCDFCTSQGGFFASAFTPSDDYDFTGAKAYVVDLDHDPFGGFFSMALYSSTSTGAPNSALWTSGLLTAPGAPFTAPTLVSASYGGSPILLQTGVEYFLVLDLTNANVGWIPGGSTSTPSYNSGNGSSWYKNVEANLQFEISGSPVAAIPEPSTWAMLLLGFAGLGLAARRKAADRARLSAPNV